jgi:hypothetical protein
MQSSKNMSTMIRRFSKISIPYLRIILFRFIMMLAVGSIKIPKNRLEQVQDIHQ